MINDQGGINGRKINFISYDDGYSPPKTVEQVRKLVESDEVFAVFQIVGTPGNSAIAKYLNQKSVPHTFVGSAPPSRPIRRSIPGAWAGSPTTRAKRGSTPATSRRTFPARRSASCYQNDDFGKDYLTGYPRRARQGFGKTIVAEVPLRGQCADGQLPVVQIKDANPDIFVTIATPKFAAQAIKKIGE